MNTFLLFVVFVPPSQSLQLSIIAIVCEIISIRVSWALLLFTSLLSLACCDCDGVVAGDICSETQGCWVIFMGFPGHLLTHARKPHSADQFRRNYGPLPVMFSHSQMNPERLIFKKTLSKSFHS